MGKILKDKQRNFEIELITLNNHLYQQENIPWTETPSGQKSLEGT